MGCGNFTRREAFKLERERFENEKEAFEEIPVFGKKPYRINPFKLKTYEDMEGDSSYILRNEAMEWVIELEFKGQSGGPDWDGKDWKKKPTPGIDPKLFMTPGEMRALGQIWIMKKIFNITNQDMQEYILRKYGIGTGNYGE